MLETKLKEEDFAMGWKYQGKCSVINKATQKFNIGNIQVLETVRKMFSHQQAFNLLFHRCINP